MARRRMRRPGSGHTAPQRGNKTRRMNFDKGLEDGTCRWCGASVVPPRRTFCNNDCVHEYLLRSNNNYMRSCIFRRDKGVCAVCGVRTSAIGKEILRQATDDDVQAIRQSYGVAKNRRVWRSKFNSAVFDVDHITRVADGGGLCGLDNLRTLCCACHKAVTWSQTTMNKATCDKAC